MLVFGDTSALACRVLMPALHAALAERPRIRLLAFIECARRPVRPPWRRLITGAARRLFDADQVLVHRDAEPPDAGAALRRAGVPVLRPPERDINHPELVRALRDDWRPTCALSIGCIQIFRSELRRACPRIVNFHNALLPKYGGIRATSWALYHGEAQTGFTFHEVTEAIDAGPILLQESVPIPPGASVSQVDHAILHGAAPCIGSLLDLVARGSGGRAQAGPATYFGVRDLREIRRIDDVADFTLAELQRRLRAFKWLNLREGAKVREVTHLRVLAPGARGGLKTSDGALIRPHRFMCMPAAPYAIYRALRRGTPL